MPALAQEALKLPSEKRSEAQRLIDFVAGGVSAIDGQAECLDPLTFVFVPEIVALRRDPGEPPS